MANINPPFFLMANKPAAAKDYTIHLLAALFLFAALASGALGSFIHFLSSPF